MENVGPANNGQAYGDVLNASVVLPNVAAAVSNPTGSYLCTALSSGTALSLDRPGFVRLGLLCIWDMWANRVHPRLMMQIGMAWKMTMSG
jgi:hypothetical protein